MCGSGWKFDIFRVSEINLLRENKFGGNGEKKAPNNKTKQKNENEKWESHERC